jgi:hypothetical protein
MQEVLPTIQDKAWPCSNLDVVIQQDRPSAPIAEFDSKVIAAARTEGLWNTDSISQVTRFGCAQSFLLMGPSVFSKEGWLCKQSG